MSFPSSRQRIYLSSMTAKHQKESTLPYCTCLEAICGALIGPCASPRLTGETHYAEQVLVMQIGPKYCAAEELITDLNLSPNPSRQLTSVDRQRFCRTQAAGRSCMS